MVPDDADTEAPDEAEQDALHRCIAYALDTLPRLTRVVYLLHSIDELPYAQIAWRCGMTVDEVTIRMADALIGIRRRQDSVFSFVGRLRYAWAPWRNDWMRLQRERQDRSLGISRRDRS